MNANAVRCQACGCITADDEWKPDMKPPTVTGFWTCPACLKSSADSTRCQINSHRSEWRAEDERNGIKWGNT